MAPQFSTQINGSMTFSASLSATMNTTTNVTASRNYRPLVPEPSTLAHLNGPSPLILSVEEADSLENLADSVLKRTLSDYLHFRDVRKRRLHDEQWKEVRRQDNLVAFKERDSWRQQHQTLCTPDGRLEPVVCKTSVPTLLVLGALQGALDDEMYGMHIDSNDAAKLRSSYIHDQVNDFRVLTRIRGATKDDPFRFCGVTWADLGNNGYGPFARKRDYCVITSMGVTTTARGERVGYYVVHSVDVSSNGPMGRTTQLGLATNGNATGSKYTRAKGSMCWLKCELPNGGVELYMQGFFAPMGSVLEFAVVNAAVNTALGLAQTSDTSYSKKIRWMLHDSVGVAIDGGLRRSMQIAFRCGQEAEVRVLHRLSCGEHCKGLTTRKVTVDVAADSVVQQTRGSICFLCMGYAKQTSATVFAAREMAHARARSNRALSTDTSEYIL
uniref:START domain-containing protein n=1 Tax=Phytophthora ramorum TaxID=164328 RepID=H3GUM9_PHYRM